MAQPDFAGAFARLDRDGDGNLEVDEITFEGVDAEHYASPVATFVTDDGFGVEVWRTPLGVGNVSMEAAGLETKRHMRDRAYPRDIRPMITSTLMIARNTPPMTPALFEERLRERAGFMIHPLDTDADGAVNVHELDMMFANLRHFRDTHPFQTGEGGDAMRALSDTMTREAYVSYDLDRDGLVVADEMLEVWLANMIAAYAPPSPG
jgi:Ca2+-binding EF-hand superfamily protein